MGKEVRKEVIYNGQPLTLERFWATGEPCLWIKKCPEQISIPKMEFVGGYPTEYCIFLKNLTAEELARITLPDGSPIDIEKEIEQLK